MALLKKKSSGKKRNPFLRKFLEWQHNRRETSILARKIAFLEHKLAYRTQQKRLKQRNLKLEQMQNGNLDPLKDREINAELEFNRIIARELWAGNRSPDVPVSARFLKRIEKPIETFAFEFAFRKSRLTDKEQAKAREIWKKAHSASRENPKRADALFDALETQLINALGYEKANLFLGAFLSKYNSATKKTLREIKNTRPHLRGIEE